MNPKILSLAAVALSLAGCGGGSNVLQFLVNWDQQYAVTVSRPNATCAAANNQNSNDVITNNAQSTIVISIYQGDQSSAAKPYFADFGSHTLAGTKGSDGTYSLQDAQVTRDSTNPNAVTVVSDTVSVTMLQTGSFISGTWTEEQYASTANSTTGCLYTTHFRGQQVSPTLDAAGVPSAGADH